MHGMNILWIALALQGPVTGPEPAPADAADTPAAEDDTDAATSDAPPSGEDPPDEAAEKPESADPFEEQATPEPVTSPATPPTTAPAPTAAPATTSPPTVVRKERTYKDIPVRWRLDLGAAGGTTFVPDRSFFAFTPGRRHLIGFTLDARVDFPIIDGRAFVGGGVSYRRFGRADGLYDGRLDTTLLVQDPLALGRFSFRFVEGIDAYAQVGGGPSIVDITASNSSVDRNASQRKVTGAFEAVGGLAVYLPKKWLPRRGSSRVTAGLDAAIGYGFRGRVDVSPNLDTADDAIATTSTSLGDVALRGLVWRAGLFVRFM